VIEVDDMQTAIELAKLSGFINQIKGPVSAPAANERM
jgi:hypothetical protein